jgi:outer membrane protein TolC
VASSRQALVASEATVEQQEVRLKNLLSRNGLADSQLRQARIELLDRINMPDKDEFPPVEEMVKQAQANRVDLALDKSNLQASQVSSQGTRNGLLPNVQAFGAMANAGLAGTPQNTPTGSGSTGGYFEGGLGTAMGMVMRRNFPTERIGVFATTPLGNRQAQADQAIDELTIRQTQLSNQKRVNQVEVDLMNALVAIRQARARYEAAVRNLKLQQELLDGEQKKYLLGASTPQSVIQLQRDLTTALSAEVSALAAYSNARLTLDQAMGRTLEASGVSIGEAKTGVVSRVSSLPAGDKPGKPGTVHSNPISK